MMTDSYFRRRLSASVLAATLIGMAPAAPVAAESDSGVLKAQTSWKEDFAYFTGLQAYMYGFPAMYYASLRYQFIESQSGPIKMGVNEYFHFRELSDPALQYGGSPNRDTPYSFAMLDLAEPLVLRVPENPERRYYTLQLTDFYSDTVGYIGLRATDNVAGDYLVTTTEWDGEIPAGIQGVVRSWTPWVFVAGRTFTDGSPEDLEKLRQFQDGYRITPLSGYGHDGVQVVTRHDVLDPAPASDALSELSTIDAVMRENPPPDRDAALVRQFGLVGIGPEAERSLDELDAATRRGLKRAQKDGRAMLAKIASAGGSVVGAAKTVNNWFYGPANWGRMAADADFLGRAGTQSFSGVTEHLIEESVKLRTFVDENGDPLSGDRRYLIRFEKDQLPQAEAFWSLTLYDENFNLVENDAKRYSYSDKQPGLRYGEDGSVVIYIQADAPAVHGPVNWLPAPRNANFNLFLRTYLPAAELLNQTYVPPRVKVVE